MSNFFGCLFILYFEMLFLSTHLNDLSERLVLVSEFLLSRYLTNICLANNNWNHPSIEQSIDAKNRS
jgi:hypothetical protein